MLWNKHTHCETHLHHNEITVVKAISGDFNGLFGTAQGVFGTFLAESSQVALADFRQPERATSGFPQDSAQAQSKLGRVESFLPALFGGFVIFILVDLVVHVDFRGLGVIVNRIVIGKENLGEFDFLVATVQVGQSSRGDSGEEIVFGSRKKGSVATFAAQDVVVKVNDQRQVRDTAVVETIAVQRLVTVAGSLGFVEELGRSKLKKREAMIAMSVHKNNNKRKELDGTALTSLSTGGGGFGQWDLSNLRFSALAFPLLVLAFFPIFFEFYWRYVD